MQKIKEPYEEKAYQIFLHIYYLIFVSIQQYTCPENVTMISSFDKGLFLSELMTCGIIIYDITQEPGQIKEICWVLKGALIQIQLI